MHRRLGEAAVLLALILFVFQAYSYAWGESADRLIANKAVDTLPEEMLTFFQANRQFLVQHVTDPEDTATKPATSPVPAPSDFIELDHYGAFPFTALPRSYNAAVSEYSRRTLGRYGLLPWQIGLYSQRLTDAFRSHNWEEAKVDAALVAHYVAAAHDPFNTTSNRDGKLSDQPGVHGRYGTGLVDRYQLFFFVKPGQAAMIHDPTDHAFEMALSAHSELEGILLSDRRAHDGQTVYSDDYYDRFYALAGTVLVHQISDASTDVGSYWMTAWINAGRPQLPPQ